MLCHASHVFCYYQIGQMYFRGEGVEKNTIKAHTLWTIAAKLGYEAADRKLKFLEKTMNQTEIEKANNLTIKCNNKGLSTCLQ